MSLRNVSQFLHPIWSTKILRKNEILLLNYTSIRSLPLFPTKKKDDEESVGVKTKDVVRVKEFLNEEAQKSNFDSKNFIKTIENFDNIRKLKRFGYSEFIAASLPAMKEFGIEKDIESYKALIKIFPRGAFIPSSKLAAGFYPHYVQQQSALKILMQMEENNVMPDKEFEQHIIDVFSKFSLVWQKCARMIYWMTKTRYANPFPLPDVLPKDFLELAIIALKRMTIYVDPQSEIYVYRTKQIEESASEDTWICFVQSDSQCKLIEDLDLETNKYRLSIDGPFNVWVRDYTISYFVLYARDTKPNKNRDLVEEHLSAEQKINDVSDIPLSNFGKLDLKEAIDPMRKIHQQDDGTILAIGATGTSSQESLLLWLRKLEQHNPRLRSIPISVTSNSKIDESLNQSDFNQIDNNFQKSFQYQLHKKKEKNPKEEKEQNDINNETINNDEIKS